MAALASKIEKETKSGHDLDTSLSPRTKGDKAIKDLVANEASVNGEEDKSQKPALPNAVDAAKTFIENRTTVENKSVNKLGQNGDFSHSEQIKMTELLGSWEDADAARENSVSQHFVLPLL